VSAGPGAAAGRGPTAAPVVSAILAGLARRPWLWPAAVAEAGRLARPGWWRRWPPLPVPDDALWRFRMETAYGGAGDAVPEAEDVASFIRWCGTMGRWRRR
jgi:hypothetical protein